MRAWFWVIIASAGFGAMVMAYTWPGADDQRAAWSSGLIVIGPGMPAEKSGDAIPVRMRLLSADDVAEILLFATGGLPPDKALGVKGQIRDKVIEVPMLIAGISSDLLQSGQMPEAGQNEVLAGAGLERRDTVNVGVHTLKVVGVLKPGLTFFANSYLIPPSAANDKLFSAAVPTVVDAWLVRSSAEEQRDVRGRKRWEAVFPPEKYAWVTAEERLEPRTYQLYLAGLAVFLLGGSGALIGFYRWLSAKIKSPILAGPLLEMKARPRLVWGVHLVYFGIVIGGSLLISAMPEAQLVLLATVRGAIASRKSVLGIAGQAYQSGNVPFAAAVTFAINYLLGSLAYITLPSILVPGSAVLLASVRAVGWGLILAPLPRPLALGMLPHSATMLLEGEGYILATIFGLLIPIHVVKRSLGGNLFTRFGRAVKLNFKAQIWIALVLAVAAIYEATEVILMKAS